MISFICIFFQVKLHHYAFDNTSQELLKEHIRETNPTIDSAEEDDIASVLRFGTEATARTKSGEIVAVSNINFKTDDMRIAAQNAIKNGGSFTYQNGMNGLLRTSHVNDYLSGYKTLEGKNIPPEAYDRFYKTIYNEAMSLSLLLMKTI